MNRHQQNTGAVCNCPKEPHGLDVGKFFKNAEKVFWMSEGQKSVWVQAMPVMKDHSGSVVLSSVFQDADLDRLKLLREQTTNRSPKWAVLGSGSWIKGVEETQKWCKLNRKSFETLPKLPYGQFLDALNKYQGFVFMPLDKDTCPRVTIEAKLMGLNLLLNDNVLSKNDPWFNGTPELCDGYLRARADLFWQTVLS